MAAGKYAGKILILATESCAYPGADAVGQGHQSYPANTYILRVRAPVLFPEHFYLDCFDKGVAGFIIMSCGVECPYEGAYEALAKRIAKVYELMKERGLDIRRLLHYVLSYPVSTAIVGISAVAHLEENVRVARAFAPLGEKEMAEIRAAARS